MHVYHVTKSEDFSQVADLGLFADLGAALVAVHEAMHPYVGMGLEVIQHEPGWITYQCGQFGLGWTIERREVR